MDNKKEILFGKTLDELTEIVKELGMQKFTAKQIAQWLYGKQAESFDRMVNISKKNRSRLSEKYEIGRTKPVTVSVSTDGTRKYLYRTVGGRFIETAYIPERNHNTLCVSSQTGCKMGCEFCATGQQKFHGQLTAGEIVNQLFSIPDFETISNIVYMGMGEPFDNYEEVKKSIDILTSDWGYGMSPRRINVSTIGIIPEMKRFIEETECHLAVSLHSPFDDERRSLMPVENAYPIKKVIDLIKQYDWRGQRRISFEYIVFEGINHSERHVKELARLLNGLRCRINLIRFHKIPNTRFATTTDHSIETFKEQLRKKGIITTIRASRGQDIDAACGLLSTKKLME
jgi:23S rRNA (adenine2503-C2)-methyltransferase